MYTADMARNSLNDDLDRRIEAAVKDARYSRTASLRVYIDDWFVHSIREELEKRGFHSIDVPDICLKGDVYFSW